MADVDIDKALDLARWRIERWEKTEKPRIICEFRLTAKGDITHGPPSDPEDVLVARALIACREPVEVLHKPVSARRSKCACGHPLIGPGVETFCPGCGRRINWREA